MAVQWMTHLYGNSNTCELQQVKVVHHMKDGGTRCVAQYGVALFIVVSTLCLLLAALG